LGGFKNNYTRQYMQYNQRSAQLKSVILARNSEQSISSFMAV